MKTVIVKLNRFTDHNRANRFKSEGDCLENGEIWNNSSPGKWRKLSFVWTVHIGKISIKFEISTVILMANFQNHLRLIITSCSVTMRNFLCGDFLYHLKHFVDSTDLEKSITVFQNRIMVLTSYPSLPKSSEKFQ